MFGRIEVVQAKKDILDAKIQQERSRPRPDSIRLQSLKRMRVRLEDDLVRIRLRAGRPAGSQSRLQRQVVPAG